MSGILREATDDDLRSFDEARATIRTHTTHDPGFDTTRNPHLRLFFANFDGTGNDVEVAPQKGTNVARIRDDIQSLNERGLNAVRTHYVEGPGTQAGRLASTRDQATGDTFPLRLEAMYGALCEQTLKWKREDPEAEVRVVSVGFSRGATEAAGFTNLLERRGIQDPTQARIEREVEPVQSSRNWVFNSHENVRVFDGPPLVAPGGVKQAVVLFDPVATGGPERYDRSLPDSVVAGLQITAKDEHRTLFPVNEIIDRTRNGEGRFLNVEVNGAHSDIGGGYSERQGLAGHSGNLAADYLNTLTGHRMFHQVEVAREDCAVHDSNSTMFRTLARMQGLPPEVDRTVEGSLGVAERTVPQGRDIRLDAAHLYGQGSHDAERTNDRTGIADPRAHEAPRDPERPQTRAVPAREPGPGADHDAILMQSMGAVARLGDSPAFRETLGKWALDKGEREGTIDPSGLSLPPEQRNERGMREHALQRLDLDGESPRMRLAAAIALESKRDGLQRIDEVVLNTDGTKLIAIQRNDGHPELARRVAVDIDAALSVPLAATAGELREAPQREALAREQARQEAPQPNEPVLPDAPGHGPRRL